MTQKNGFSKDFGFREQIQRSAISIPSDVAEGDEPDTNKQSVRHFFIAKGSCAELMTQIIIGQEIGYIDQSDYNDLIESCKTISVMLARLIKARS